jgi:hypothetical protein
MNILRNKNLNMNSENNGNGQHNEFIKYNMNYIFRLYKGMAEQQELFEKDPSKCYEFIHKMMEMIKLDTEKWVQIVLEEIKEKNDQTLTKKTPKSNYKKSKSFSSSSHSQNINDLKRKRTDKPNKKKETAHKNRTDSDNEN